MAVETLGQALDLSWRLEMRCTKPSRIGTAKTGRCSYTRALDLETLVCTRGRAFPLAHLAQRLKCPRCGDTMVRVLFLPPSVPTRAAASR